MEFLRAFVIDCPAGVSPPRAAPFYWLFAAAHPPFGDEFVSYEFRADVYAGEVSNL